MDSMRKTCRSIKIHLATDRIFCAMLSFMSRSNDDESRKTILLSVTCFVEICLFRSAFGTTTCQPDNICVAITPNLSVEWIFWWQNLCSQHNYIPTYLKINIFFFSFDKRKNIQPKIAKNCCKKKIVCTKQTEECYIWLCAKVPRHKVAVISNACRSTHACRRTDGVDSVDTRREIFVNEYLSVWVFLFLFSDKRVLNGFYEK